mmetsp:Transcript_6079/g.13083  ORF Transcript_6079/g.13083 Transcript_6079/m.13083 type:complete len:314 (+) Transcript_6079:56-997(+)
MLQNKMITFILTFLVALSNISASSALISPFASNTGSTSHLINFQPRQYLSVRHAEPQTDGKKSSSARSRGIYSRPSAAIERGSGFFLPGLEGYRIRALSGLFSLGATAYNQYLMDTAGASTGTSESTSAFIAYVSGFILLALGIAEWAGESFQFYKEEMALEAPATIDEQEELNDGFLPSEVVESVRRVSSAFLQVTVATSVALVSSDGLVPYRVGAPHDMPEAAAKRAANLVRNSKGGRIAVPSDDVAAEAMSEGNRRSILVQIIGDSRGKVRIWALVVGSDRPLQAYSEGDLRWLGCLSERLVVDGIQNNA